MGLSRRQFLTSTTLIGATMVVACSKRVGGQAKPDPADLNRVTESSSAPPGGLDIVRVGIIPFEPYTVGTGEDLEGPIPDVARKILTDLGTPEVEFVLMNEQEKIQLMLLAGDLDVAGGLALRPDLCRNMTFSDPDFVSGTALAVPAGNPKGLRTYAEAVAQGASVAVLPGAPEQEDATKAGVTNLVPLPDPNTLIDAVTAGRADCFAFDHISLRHMVATFGQGLEVADPFMPEGRLPFVGAYAFSQGSDLVEPFNEALKELHDSGEWLRMVEPFEFTEDNEPPADLTADKACAG